MLVEIVKPPQSFELILLELSPQNLRLFNLLLLLKVLKVVHIEILLVNLFALRRVHHIDIPLDLSIKVSQSPLIFIDHLSHASSRILLIDLNSLIVVLSLLIEAVFLLLLELFLHPHLVSHKVCIDLRLLHQILKPLPLQQRLFLFLLTLLHLLVKLLFLSLDVCKLFVSLLPECEHILCQLLSLDCRFLREPLSSNRLLPNLLQSVDRTLFRVGL